MAPQLSRLEQLVTRVPRDLRDAGARHWALVGGIAVGVRCEPRFTRDVDVVVAVADDQEAEAIVRSLLGAGYRPASVLDHESGRMATVRLVAPGESETGILLDLLFTATSVEPEVAQAATVVEVFPGVSVPVAQRGDLIA
ncbi:MAG TPA: nucleotidyl transferase AbiEii/AbiGii toxin family protein, partial [Myxococcales bacterium]|nr:nucleotidyl transferase AbiEii/AbiGii toxin family protein [Myxococcales bacterium]